MEDYKKLLIDLYTIHDPERIKQIDYFLERYKGKEKQFYISQKAKYKNKKPISDSKKIIEEALARIKSQSKDKPKLKSKTKEKPEASKERPIQKIATPPIDEKNLPDTSADIDLKKPEIIKKPTEPIIEKPIKEAIPSPPISNKADQTEAEKLAQEKPLPAPVIVEDKKKAEPKKESPKAPHSEKDKHFNKKYFLYILGIVVLVIILIVLIYFVFFYNAGTKDTQKPIEKPNTTINKKDEKTTPPVETTPTVKPETKTDKEGQQSSRTSNKFQIKKGDINLPTYFIACYAVKKESLAIKKVNILKSKGFEASYYWIPEFVPNGNTYYKVVIGPFSSRLNAMRKLTAVQERAEFDAYVLELK